MLIIDTWGEEGIGFYTQPIEYNLSFYRVTFCESGLYLAECGDDRDLTFGLIIFSNYNKYKK